jgi:hypothetical protein
MTSSTSKRRAAVLALEAADWVRRHHGVHCARDFLDYPRVLGVERNPKPEYTARVSRDAPVAQIDPEEIDIARREGIRVVEVVTTCRTRRTRAGPSPARDPAANPVAHRAAWDPDERRDLRRVESLIAKIESRRNLCPGPRHRTYVRASVGRKMAKIEAPAGVLEFGRQPALRTPGPKGRGGSSPLTRTSEARPEGAPLAFLGHASRRPRTSVHVARKGATCRRSPPLEVWSDKLIDHMEGSG